MAYGKPIEEIKYFICPLVIVRYIFNSGGAEEIRLNPLLIYICNIYMDLIRAI